MNVLFSGTMGVCLYPCSLPGGGPLFQLGANEIELGMGESYCDVLVGINLNRT